MKTFLEIGACDFNNLDPFLEAGWRGVFVEPIPVYADSLRNKVLKYPNATVVEAAISGTIGEIHMDTLKYTPAPGNEWMKGISHISSKNYYNNTSGLVHRTRSNTYPQETVKVKCITLDTLIAEQDITSIDMLQLDVEGHELVVLRNYSWAIKPKVMRIEHTYIDDVALVELLTKQGYHCFLETEDVYAVLK